MRRLSSFVLTVVACLLAGSCALFKANPSQSVGSAYLFGLGTRESPDEYHALQSPYTAATRPIERGDSYAIVLNRMWLRYLDDVEADTVVYVEVFEGSSPKPQSKQILLHRVGMPQGAFTGQADVTIWGPKKVEETPIRMALYVFEFDRNERNIFELIAGLVEPKGGDIPATESMGSVLEVVRNLLLRLHSDSIDFAYDVTFHLPPPGATDPSTEQRALFLGEASYVVIKGESGYRSARIPDFAVTLGVPFNWAGLTIDPAAQKREIETENNDVELFQYGRYRNESFPNALLGVVGETIFSAVRLPFFILWSPFRRFYTRDTGTPLDRIRWVDGELRIVCEEKPRRPKDLYTDKSWFVFSIVRTGDAPKQRVLAGVQKIDSTRIVLRAAY